MPLLVILVLGLAVAGGLSGRQYRNHFIADTRTELEDLAMVVGPRFVPLIAHGDRDGVQELCREIGETTGVRLTVVTSGGEVIGDSDEKPAYMDNHADRPEIQEALAGRAGHSERYSSTTETRRVYVAVPAGNPDHRFVVRASQSLANLNIVLRRVTGGVILAGLLVAALGGLASFLVTRGLGRTLVHLRDQAEGISRGDFGQHLRVSGPAELLDLADTMNSMSDLLREQIRAIEGQRQELEAVMDSMVEGLLAVDRDETVLRMNEAAGRLLATDVERAVGRSIQEVARNPGLTELVQQVLAHGGTAVKDLTLGSRAEICLQVTSTELSGGSGDRIGALLVLNDVTRLRRLETMRRDFVANVSHELKTPITTIKGFVETLLETPPAAAEDLERFLGIINRQADRLDAIISDLLALSRLEEDTDDGGIEVHDLPLYVVLERVVRETTAHEPPHASRIVLDCSDDVRATLNAPLLEQAVGNLLDNALKYSPDGTPVVIACGMNEDTVHITVSDQGPGIAAEHLPRLFERFYRVDKARSRQVGGTGLGLAIVKHIAQAHRGTVAVASEVGRGTTFTISLPREVPA